MVPSTNWWRNDIVCICSKNVGCRMYVLLNFWQLKVQNHVFKGIVSWWVRWDSPNEDAKHYSWNIHWMPVD